MDLDDEDVKPRKKRGRPRKVSTVTRQEYIDDGTGDVLDEETPDRADNGFSSLFDRTSEKQIVKVRVIRRDPNEGTLGYLEDPMQGEAEIKQRWGGSTYTLNACNARGQCVGTATLKIAGDPIFESKAAEIQWRRSRGLPAMSSDGSTSLVAGAADKGMTTQELLMFLQTVDEKRRSEEREHQERMRKLELEAADKARRDDEERERRRAKDDEERERRKRLDDEERDQRRRREQQEAEQRSQQFMQQTVQMIQASSTQALQFAKGDHGAGGAPIMEAVKMVVAIKEAFAGDNAGGGDGDADPLSLVIKHGGEWLNGLGGAISGAIREVKGGGGTPGPTAAQPSALAMLPPGNPLLGKVEVLAAKLAAKGHNPEVALSAIVDSVIKDVEKMPPMNGRAAAPAATGPIPFQQSAVGVAGGPPVESPTVTTPVSPEVPKRNVVRMQFGKAN